MVQVYANILLKYRQAAEGKKQETGNTHREVEHFHEKTSRYHEASWRHRCPSMQDVSTHTLIIIRLIQLCWSREHNIDWARVQFTSPLVHAMHLSASSLSLCFCNWKLKFFAKTCNGYFDFQWYKFFIAFKKKKKSRPLSYFKIAWMHKNVTSKTFSKNDSYLNRQISKYNCWVCA